MTRWRIDPRHVNDVHLALGLLFPAAAGVALFGFRCVGVWAFVLAGAFVGRAVLRRLRTWTATPGRLHLVTQSVVVGLFCPAVLFEPDRTNFQADAKWPVLVAAGVLLSLFAWAAKRVGRRWLHPAVLTAAVLMFVSPALFETDRVLPPQQIVTGDVLDARTADRSSGTAEPWIDLPDGPARVLITPPADRTLQTYLRGTPPPGRVNQTVTRLLSDDLPPLEDLVVGGHPMPLGRGSVIAVVIGGLYLVYRGLTPLRVPALGLLACYATLVVLPLPAGVGGGGVRRWLFERDPRVGWAAGLTLVHYLLAASSVPLTATFLLPQPGVRPRGKRVAALFAITFGVLAGVATVFVSVAGGALLALAVTQAVWPGRRPRPLRVHSPGTPGQDQGQ